MSRFLDPRLQTLTPYTPGEQPPRGVFIKLNTNESPFPPAPGVAGAVEAAVPTLHLYSDNTAASLHRTFADQTGLAAEQVAVGNGSDELLAFCFQALCPNGAAFADITYGFYPVFCRLYGVDAHLVPLREDFSLHPADYAELGHTLFIANPNAPTGLALSREQVAMLCANDPTRLVIIDEAYVHFGAESALPLLADFDNLLIVGTFSKSRSLAGGRLGYAFGSRALIADIERVRNSFNPYNVNSLTLAAAEAALADEAYFAGCTTAIIQTRKHTLARLREMGFACTDSVANFIFASHPHMPAQTLQGALREEGIFVRWWDAPRIQNHLRISVGTDWQMDALLAALEHILTKGTSPS